MTAIEILAAIQRIKEAFERTEKIYKDMEGKIEAQTSQDLAA